MPASRISRIVTADRTISDVFTIESGRQVTLHAIGLQGDDHVIIEILGLSRAGPGGTFCCPNPAGPAEVTEALPLRCRNGARVILTANFPTVTLDTPQEVPLRARVIADISASITVDTVDTENTGGCDTCPCIEPYCPSYPLPGGGYGFVDGDMRDPEATVDVQACNGQGPVAWIFPTPRPNATTPQYSCSGAIVGYGANRSHCSMETNEQVPCVAKTTVDHSVAEDQGTPVAAPTPAPIIVPANP